MELLSLSFKSRLPPTEPPGPVMNLKPGRIGRDYVTLAWEPPSDDGGSKVTAYLLEKQEARKVDEWVKVTETKDFNTAFRSRT